MEKSERPGLRFCIKQSKPTQNGFVLQSPHSITFGNWTDSSKLQMNKISGFSKDIKAKKKYLLFTLFLLLTVVGPSLIFPPEWDASRCKPNKNNNSNPVPGKKKTNRTIPGRKSGGKVIKSILAANDLCWHQTSHYGQHQRPTPAAPSPPQSINKVSDVDPHHQCTGYNQACHWSKLSKQFRIISE